MARSRLPSFALGGLFLGFLACSTFVEDPTGSLGSLGQAVSASGPGQLLRTEHGGWLFGGANKGNWLSGDFDGDGYTDVAEAIAVDAIEGRSVCASGTCVAVHVDFGHPDTSGERIQSFVVHSMFPSTLPHRFVAGDFDKDGRTDVAAIHDDGAGHSVIDMLRSTGAGFVRTSTQTAAWPYAANEQWLAGDFDLKGGADIAAARNDGGLVSIGVLISTGTSFATMAPWQTRQGGWADDAAWVVGDYDNDGRADLATVWNDGGYNSFAMRRALPGGGFSAETWDTKDGGWLASSRWVAGDFDGDGVVDLAAVWNDAGVNSVGVYPSHFTGFKGSWQYTNQHTNPPPGQFHDGLPWLAGDFNGDGGIDILGVDVSTLPKDPFILFANQATTSAFIRLGGEASAVAPMPDGSLAALTAHADASGNLGLVSRKTFPLPGDDSWAPAPGSGGVVIEGGPGGPYVVKANGDVVMGNGALLDKRAKDIGVAPDGTIWIISDEAQWGGYRIYRRKPGAAWEYMQGAGVAIDAGPTGAWVVNDLVQAGGQIFQYTNGWQQISGAALDVTVSPEGTVYVIGTTPRAHGHIAYRRDGASWTELPGMGADRIDAGANGAVYATTQGGVVYVLDYPVSVTTFDGPEPSGTTSCASFPETGGTWKGWWTFGVNPATSKPYVDTFCSYTWYGTATPNTPTKPMLSSVVALGREQGGIVGADGYTLTQDAACNGPGCTHKPAAMVSATTAGLVCLPVTPPADLGVPVPVKLGNSIYNGVAGCSVCRSPMVGQAVSGTIYAQLPATAERDAAGNVTLYQQSIANGTTTYTQVGTVNAPAPSAVVASAAVPDGPLWAKTVGSTFTQ